MKWQIELRPEAIADLDDAAAWYEGKSAGLGRDLVREVSAAISSLALGPLTLRLRHRSAGIRWIYPRRFPYRIVYRVEAERVVVLAILHAARSDAVWRRRE
jgi:plasmid stabilization system protein ParE